MFIHHDYVPFLVIEIETFYCAHELPMVLFAKVRNYYQLGRECGIG